MGVFQISGLVNYTTEEFLIYREETEEKFSGLNCSFFHLYDHISLSHDLNPFLINLTRARHENFTKLGLNFELICQFLRISNNYHPIKLTDRICEKHLINQ